MSARQQLDEALTALMVTKSLKQLELIIKNFILTSDQLRAIGETEGGERERGARAAVQAEKLGGAWGRGLEGGRGAPERRPAICSSCVGWWLLAVWKADVSNIQSAVRMVVAGGQGSLSGSGRDGPGIAIPLAPGRFCWHA